MAVVALYVVTAGGGASKQTSVLSPNLQAELSAARADISARSEELKRSKAVLEATNQELEHVRHRLSELEAERAKAHSQPQPTDPHANHDGMQTRDPKRLVLHPKLGRNELNKWSDMKLDRALVREFARVDDSHLCRAHSWPPYFNSSDPLCTIGAPEG